MSEGKMKQDIKGKLSAGTQQRRRLEEEEEERSSWGGGRERVRRAMELWGRVEE